MCVLMLSVRPKSTNYIPACVLILNSITQCVLILSVCDLILSQCVLLYMHVIPPPPLPCRSDTTLAVSVRAATGRPALQHHLMGGQRGRVQTPGPRGGFLAVGDAQTQAAHELRQAEQSHQVLLRQEDHEQSARKEIRLQVQL